MNHKFNFRPQRPFGGGLEDATVLQQGGLGDIPQGSDFKSNTMSNDPNSQR